MAREISSRNALYITLCGKIVPDISMIFHISPIIKKAKINMRLM